MTWFDILKKDGGWVGELKDGEKEELKKTPKVKVDIPDFDVPSNESEIPDVLEAMKDKKLEPKEMPEIVFSASFAIGISPASICETIFAAVASLTSVLSREPSVNCTEPLSLAAPI